MKDEKGVTLISLIITIIILGILSTIAIVSSRETVDYAKFNKVKNQFEYLQNKTNYWNLEYNNIEGDSTKSREQKQAEFIDSIGRPTSYCNQNDLQYTFQATEVTSIEDYRFLSKQYLNSILDIEYTCDFLVNVITNDVILFKGFLYEGDLYYTAKDFGLEKITNVAPVKDITFEIESNRQNREIIIKNLVFLDDNYNQISINNFIVECSVSDEGKWEIVNERMTKFEENDEKKYKFTVNTLGSYDITIMTTDKQVVSIEQTIDLLN